MRAPVPPCLLTSCVALFAALSPGAVRASPRAEGSVASEQPALAPDVPDEEATPAPPAPAPPAPAPPAPAPPAPGDGDTLAFADHLFLDGDYYRAITEYRRFLFRVRGLGEHAPRAALAIGEALLRGEQWDAAGRQLDRIAERATDEGLRHTALFAAGRAYLLDGRPELAKPRFRLLSKSDDTAPALRASATWLLAWGHFDAGEYDDARALFGSLVLDEGPHASDARGVIEALEARAGLSQKDPLLAGVLSIVPGLGHLYLERPGLAATSLIWNGVFLYGAAHAWLEGQWGLAVVLSFFELSWYAGGIFGAVTGALRHNRDVYRNWRDDVLYQYGASRELPALPPAGTPGSEVPLPGSLLRFGGAF